MILLFPIILYDLCLAVSSSIWGDQQVNRKKEASEKANLLVYDM